MRYERQFNFLITFNTNPIPRSLKYDANLLDNVASRLIPSNESMPNTFSIEILYRTSILNNITNWCWNTCGGGGMGLNQYETFLPLSITILKLQIY
jgi:hypothetical protein